MKKNVYLLISASLYFLMTPLLYSLSFSADIEAREGTNEMKGKIYVSGEKNKS